MIPFLKKFFQPETFSKSSHYDGKQFFNLNVTPQKNFFDIIKMLSSKEDKKWPKFIPLSIPSFSPVNLQDNEVNLTFINHASFLIQLKNLTILTDPIFSERAGPGGWLGPKRVRQAGIKFDELPQVQVILISHNHFDHMDMPSLIKLNKKFKPLFIVPLGNKKYLQKNAIQNVIELDWWEKHTLNATQSITIVPAQHWSRRSFMDTNAALWGGFWLTSQSLNIYFSGDTGYSDHFKNIHKTLGAPDISLLPIGAYLPEWFMRASHLNPEEAVLAHIDLKSKLSIAMHHRTFKLSHEEIDAPASELLNSLKKHGIDIELFKIPENGDNIFYKK